MSSVDASPTSSTKGTPRTPLNVLSGSPNVVPPSTGGGANALLYSPFPGGEISNGASPAWNVADRTPGLSDSLVSEQANFLVDAIANEPADEEIIRELKSALKARQENEALRDHIEHLKKRRDRHGLGSVQAHDRALERVHGTGGQAHERERRRARARGGRGGGGEETRQHDARARVRDAAAVDVDASPANAVRARRRRRRGRDAHERRRLPWRRRPRGVAVQQPGAERAAAGLPEHAAGVRRDVRDRPGSGRGRRGASKRSRDPRVRAAERLARARGADDAFRGRRGGRRESRDGGHGPPDADQGSVEPRGGERASGARTPRARGAPRVAHETQPRSRVEGRDPGDADTRADGHEGGESVQERGVLAVAVGARRSR